MNNSILNYMIEQRNGMYCHALEVHGKYDLECTIENFIDGLQDKFTKEEFKEFFKTIELYHLYDDEITEEENEIEENNLYNFDIDSFIDDVF